jgi:glycosyltransferase involved in cell wall biosynthesis
MEYPNVSILMPSYNRRKFLPLIAHNLMNMDYDKSKLEWCIFDDGAEPLFTDETLKQTRKLLSPLKIVYKYDKKKHDIGVKRNIYFSSYIKHSVETLKNNKAGLVGSNHMLFIYPEHNYKMSMIQCQAKRQIHEATMCFTKKYFNSMPGFAKSSLGEGAKMIDNNENNTAYTNIKRSMICFCHSGNSFNKEQFYKYKIDIRLKNMDIINMLQDICGIKYDVDKPDTDDEDNNDIEESVEVEQSVEVETKD